MKLIVEFYSELEELSVKRTNLAIRSVLNVLDVAQMDEETKSKMRKVVIDEINGLKRELLEYFKVSKNGDI